MVSAPLVKLHSTKVYRNETVQEGDTVFTPAESTDPIIGTVSMILPSVWGETLIIAECHNGSETEWWAANAGRCEKGRKT